MDPVKVLLTTFGREEDATSVIRTLVRERLIACGTLFRGARSIYIWEGNLEDTEEIVVLLKTTTPIPAAARLKELHPYDIPEILTLAPEAVDPSYAQWVKTSCSGTP